MLPTDIYKLNQIRGASPQELHILLLAAFEKQLVLFCDAIKKSDLHAQQTTNSKLLDILEILMQQVQDPDNALMANLRIIYLSWYNEVCNQLNLNRYADLVQVLEQVKELRGAWAQLQSSTT